MVGRDVAVAGDPFGLNLLEPAGIGELLDADSAFVALDVIRIGPIIDRWDAEVKKDVASDEFGRAGGVGSAGSDLLIGWRVGSDATALVVLYNFDFLHGAELINVVAHNGHRTPCALRGGFGFFLEPLHVDLGHLCTSFFGLSQF